MSSQSGRGIIIKGNDVFRTPIRYRTALFAKLTTSMLLKHQRSSFFPGDLSMTFFFTLFVIMFFGFALNRLAKLVRIPALVFYLLFGMLLCFIDSKVSSPSFRILDDGFMGISSYIKKIALIIILLKAGLSLDMRDLRKVGRPAILMSFLPATVEMVAVGLLAPLFFNLSYTESFLLGSVLGAVSPAVVIPMMSKLLEEKYGTKEGIPQLIIAGSSIDDIVMIVPVFLDLGKRRKHQRHDFPEHSNLHRLWNCGRCFARLPSLFAAEEGKHRCGLELHIASFPLLRSGLSRGSRFPLFRFFVLAFHHHISVGLAQKKP